MNIMNSRKNISIYIYIYSKNFRKKINFNIDDINFINIKLYYTILF